MPPSAMRAADTHVVVRLLTRDDAAQVAAAEAFVRSGAWVSHVVLAEAIWVLTSAYGLEARRIGLAIELLLAHDCLVLEDAATVAAALARFRAHPKVDFTDCLVLEIARRNGQLPLGTFDRALGAVDGAERLTG